jgi:hypothetical protein
MAAPNFFIAMSNSPALYAAIHTDTQLTLGGEQGAYHNEIAAKTLFCQAGRDVRTKSDSEIARREERALKKLPSTRQKLQGARPGESKGSGKNSGRRSTIARSRTNPGYTTAVFPLVAFGISIKRGIRRVNVDPAPGSLVTPILPPSSSVNFLTM